MGVRTTSWGGPLWYSCFCMAINYNDHPSPNKREIYLDYFDVLGDMLPCMFCRDYYNECKKVLPLHRFIDDITLEYPVMYWLYLLKDLVNQKLIRQENECYHNEANKVDNDTALSPRSKLYKKTELRNQLFYTQPSPPFELVLNHYLSLKSTCESQKINQTLQSCRHIPKSQY